MLSITERSQIALGMPTLRDLIEQTIRAPVWTIIGRDRDLRNLFVPRGSTQAFQQRFAGRIEVCSPAMPVGSEADDRFPGFLVLAAFTAEPDLDSPAFMQQLELLARGVEAVDSIDLVLLHQSDWLRARRVSDGHFLDQITQLLDTALAQSLQPMRSPNLPTTGNLFREISEEIPGLEKVRREVAGRLEILLQRHVGIQPVSVAEGREIARRINQLVASFGCRLRAGNFGAASTINYAKSGGATPGAFYFPALQEGKAKNVYAGKSLPKLFVVPAPPDRRHIRPSAERRRS